MSYAFEHGEELSSGLLRVIAEEAAEAQGHLSQEQANPDTALHEARKALKRIRAALRLLREGIGERYDLEYRFYRDVGRRLSAARDRWVVADTLRQLAAMTDNAWTRSRLEEIASEELSDGSPGLLVFESGLAGELVAELAERRGRVASLGVESDAVAVVAASLARTYRSGRRRMREALHGGRVGGSSDDGVFEPMHAWRRRAKDLWYQVSLFVPAWEGCLAPLAQALSDLSQDLGALHDLAVVRRALEERAPELAGTEPVMRLFRDRAEELRASAAHLGPRIYAERPKPFAGRVLSVWRTWHADAAASPRVEIMEITA